MPGNWSLRCNNSVTLSGVRPLSAASAGLVSGAAFASSLIGAAGTVAGKRRASRTATPARHSPNSRVVFTGCGRERMVSKAPFGRVARWNVAEAAVPGLPSVVQEAGRVFHLFLSFFGAV